MKDSTGKVEFDFDYWCKLAKSDPEVFEQKRQQQIETYLDDVPDAEIRLRLQGLQWRIEMERKLSKTPMEAAIRIYDMMWESMGRNYEELQRLAGMLDPELGIRIPPDAPKARVLQFDRERAEATH